MENLIETIRVAVCPEATAEQKAAAATACRTLLSAFEAEAGKAMTVLGAPPPSPLAGIDPTQALNLLIARLSAALPPESATAERPKDRAVRFAFVKPTPSTPRR